MLDILELHIESSKRREGRCTFGAWVDGLDEKNKAAFAVLEMNKSTVVLKDLYNDLLEAGVKLPVKSTQFYAHMKGACQCKK
jgi:hypothetical protein